MDEKFGWWGKYHTFAGMMRMVWIGPMTKAEMKEHFNEFRHNWRRTPPTGEYEVRLAPGIYQEG